MRDRLTLKGRKLGEKIGEVEKKWLDPPFYDPLVLAYFASPNKCAYIF